MDQPQKAKFVAIGARHGPSGQVGRLAVAIKTGAEQDPVQSRYCLSFFVVAYFGQSWISEISK